MQKTLLTFSCGLLLLFQSCNKEIYKSNISTDRLTITEAQDFYSQSQKDSSKKSGDVFGNSIASASEPVISPIWSKADTLSDKRYHIVELPVTETEKIALINNGVEGDRLVKLNKEPNGVCRLIVAKDKLTEKMEVALMRITAYTDAAAASLNQNTYKKKQANFTGLVLFTTLDNRFINGWRFANGRPTDSVSIKSVFFDKNVQTTNKVVTNGKLGSVKPAKNTSVSGIPIAKLGTRPNEMPDDGDGSGGEGGTSYCSQVPIGTSRPVTIMLMAPKPVASGNIQTLPILQWHAMQCPLDKLTNNTITT